MSLGDLSESLILHALHQVPLLREVAVQLFRDPPGVELRLEVEGPGGHCRARLADGPVEQALYKTRLMTKTRNGLDQCRKVARWLGYDIFPLFPFPFARPLASHIRK